MDWIRKAPTAVVVSIIVVVGVTILAVLGGFVALELTDRGTDDYWVFVSRFANLITVPLTGLAAAGSVAAWKSSSKAEDNTNGHLSDKDDEIRQLRAQIIQLRALNRPR